MAELWKLAPDWPYEVSNLGRVRNKKGLVLATTAKTATEIPHEQRRKAA